MRYRRPFHDEKEWCRLEMPATLVPIEVVLDETRHVDDDDSKHRPTPSTRWLSN